MLGPATHASSPAAFTRGLTRWLADAEPNTAAPVLQQAVALAVELSILTSDPDIYERTIRQLASSELWECAQVLLELWQSPLLARSAILTDDD